MIQPRNAQETEYVHQLAAFLIRAHEQVAAGDRPGSVQFTDAYRSLKTWGDTRYPRENQGLVEWADMLARENPRNSRLVLFMTEQDARIKKPEPAPVPSVSGEAKVGPYPVRAAEPPKKPEPPPTTLANVVQRPSDKKSDKPAEPKPATPKRTRKPAAKKETD